MKVLQVIRPPECHSGDLVWTNTTGASVAAYEVVPVLQGTNQAHIMVVGPQSIAANATGTVYRKGRFQFPANAQAYTNGQVVQWATGVATVTAGGTASGLINVGIAVDATASVAAATASVVGVPVDINEGPKAFYQW